MKRGSKRGVPGAQQAHRPFSEPSGIAEKSLWDQVKRTVDPLDAKQRALYSQALEEFLGGSPKTDLDILDPRQPQSASNVKQVKAKDTVAKPSQTSGVEATKQKGANPIVALDRKVKKRIARGTVPIDATLDLHGMRQHEAEAALRHFIWRCHGRSMRTLLVITGKGGRAVQRNGEDPPWAVGTGVLRRAVPQWLSSPQLRAAVLSFEPANANHGGSGALYVRLRAKPDAGNR